MIENVEERVQAVQARLASACKAAGRSVDEVTLVAVSKRHTPERVREAVDAGLVLFGENRVQEAAVKIPMLPGHLHWHLIGHLQSNKARVAVQLFEMIHSVDSLNLLNTINRLAGECGRCPRVCLEINVSGELAKFGVTPEKGAELVATGGGLPHVELCGLMTMPPFTVDPEGARPHFRRLRELRDEWQSSTGVPLPELSMGMSHDFEVAIEEGATMVRVGTDIFGKRTA